MTGKIKWILLAACVIAFVILIVFGSIPRDKVMHMQSEVHSIDLPEEEAIAKATHIVDAVYIGKATHDSSEQMFRPIEAIKGELDENDVELIYVISPKPFTENEKYTLCLEKNSSVYYEHNKYVLIGEVMTLDNGNIANSKPSLTGYGVEVSDSNEISELIDFSANIFTVKITGVFADGDKTTVYNCTVTRTFKGTPPEDLDIMATLFNNTVNIGEEYLILFADATKTAPVYTLSSKTNCVYSLGDAKSIPELNKLLEQYAK